AVGPQAAGRISLDAPITKNLSAVADALGKRVSEVTVIVLDRPRHAGLIAEMRRAGARIRMISDGDVAAAVATALDGTGIDMMVGIGGAPEGVLAAAALRCLGGELQGRLWPEDEDDRQRAAAMLGARAGSLLTMKDLVGDDDVIFAATGITSGDMFEGVSFTGGGVHTDSLAMRAVTGTVRFIKAIHQPDRKPLVGRFLEPHNSNG
ncbi:MAG: fructose-bisphosphatase class II, partial [Thermaerobacterales bacterium]